MRTEAIARMIFKREPRRDGNGMEYVVERDNVRFSASGSEGAELDG